MDTIIVDENLCTKCGTCSEACPLGIINPAGEETFPNVREENSGKCIRCGHCEAFCPKGALILNFRPEEKEILPEGAGEIPEKEIGFYLKKRRSARMYKAKSVPRGKIEELLEVASYAPSAENGQPVEWIVVHDPEKVRKIGDLTVEWMKTFIGSDHPASGFFAALAGIYEGGYDVICRGAPHMLFNHIPEDKPVAPVDGIIAMTYFDVAAPAAGIGTCWAGFVAMAAAEYEPLQKEIGIPAGRKCSYAMMFGYPKHTVHGIPRRDPVKVTWI
ncbi:nitroreductase family protein [Methanoplanus endosymbiosus]|uniref:Nitroreductase family protein n=1 Tax=Methanoplanus endosymbiosus TaxID=33865 RepID=A0A9E7TKN1_9EURY|nr:nitroreductase family protein [Methanoplanus endosymbiosus]UUX91381.1 nitroreductase family protein [Methanoplanus endosymbiosus]